MRRAVALPTLGMIGAFFLGMVIMVFWGMSGAVKGSQMISEFFKALSVLFLSSAMGIVLLVLLIILIIRVWYIMVPFFLGIFVGLFIMVFLGSSLASGISILIFRVIDFNGAGGSGRDARVYPLKFQGDN